MASVSRWARGIGLALAVACQPDSPDFVPRGDDDVAPDSSAAAAYPPVVPVMVREERSGKVVPARITLDFEEQTDDHVTMDTTFLFEFRFGGAHAWLRAGSRPRAERMLPPDGRFADPNCSDRTFQVSFRPPEKMVFPIILADAMYLPPEGGRLPAPVFDVYYGSDVSGCVADVFSSYGIEHPVSGLVKIELDAPYPWREASPLSVVPGDPAEMCGAEGWQVRRASPDDPPHDRFGPSGALDESGVLWQGTDHEGRGIPASRGPLRRVFLKEDCSGEEYVAQVNWHNVVYSTWGEAGPQGGRAADRAVYWDPQDGPGVVVTRAWLLVNGECVPWFGPSPVATNPQGFRVMPLRTARTPETALSELSDSRSTVWLEPPVDRQAFGRCVKARFGWADVHGTLVARTEGVPVVFDAAGRLWDVHPVTGRPTAPPLIMGYYAMPGCEGDPLVVEPWFDGEGGPLPGGRVVRVDGAYRVVDGSARRVQARSGMLRQGCSDLPADDVSHLMFYRLEDFPIVPEDEIPTFEFAVPFHPVPLDP
jgi:hypothetical protein